MKVSIITTTFNSAATLHHNLISVARQSHPFIEHIIIDNCSSDATLEIVKGYPHVASVISEKDQGIYDAMNKGIKRATGDIIGILNSDDYLASADTIAQIVAAFANTSTDAVYGNLVYVNNKRPDKIQRIWTAGGYNPQLFYRGWMLPHPTFYVRRYVYERYGLYDTSFRFAADYEMILRLLLRHNINVAPIRQVLVYMLAGGSGNKNLGTRVAVNLEDRRAWRVVGLTPRWYTLYAKPLRKLWQYVSQYFSVDWMVHIPPAQDADSFINQDRSATPVVDMRPQNS